jgi:2-polyprenyl-3-methyl-5-hydroxy-6-metoxy-1,4-benzoquinol methylase
MSRDLSVRAIEEERMDAADLEPELYTQVLGDLSKVNRAVMASRATIGFMNRAIGPRKSFRLLDVGYGHGDMLRTIARWAARRGIDATLVGIDLNPNSAPAARAATPAGLPIDYRTGDYAALAGEPWDMIVSSLVAHHMSHAQLIAFLRFMQRHARAGWLVNDLHRHVVAYHGFPILARLAGWHGIVRHDGQLSVARAYRPGEWPALLREAGVDEARVYRVFPFRLCVERLR